MEPPSLLITGLHLAAELSAEAWGEVLGVLGELAGITLPTADWIDLLDHRADPAVASPSEAAPASAKTAA